MLTINAVAVCGTLLTICSIPLVTSRRLLFSSGPVTARNRARSVALGSSSMLFSCCCAGAKNIRGTKVLRVKGAGTRLYTMWVS